MIVKRNVRTEKDSRGNLVTLVVLDDDVHEYRTKEGKDILHLMKHCAVQVPWDDALAQMPEGSPIPGEIIALEDEFEVIYGQQGKLESVHTVFAYRCNPGDELKYRTRTHQQLQRALDILQAELKKRLK